MITQQFDDDRSTFVLLFARNQPSCDVPYLMAHGTERIYPMVLTTTFYFMRDLVDYRAIVLHNCVYVIGGRYASTGRLSPSVFKYDAAIDFWRSCDAMKAPRINFAVTTFDSKIYVLGGEGLKGEIIQTVEAYDPTTDRWKEVGMLSKPRRNHATCTVHDHIWSCGGASSLADAQTTDELVIADPRAEEWRRSSTVLTLPEPRQQHCLTFINNSIVVFGGCEKNGDDVQNICTVTRAAYHSLESVPKWEEIDMQLQCPRTDCGFFQLGSNLYVVGGHDCQTGLPTKTIERIDFSRPDDVTIDEHVDIDKDLGAVDCCVVQTSQRNENLLPVASYLDHWIVW